MSKKHSSLVLTDPNFTFWERILIKSLKISYFRAKSIDLGWIFVQVSQKIVNYGDDFISHIPHPPGMYDYDCEIATNERGPGARPKATRSSGVLHVL